MDSTVSAAWVCVFEGASVCVWGKSKTFWWNMNSFSTLRCFTDSLCIAMSNHTVICQRWEQIQEEMQKKKMDTMTKNCISVRIINLLSPHQYTYAHRHTLTSPITLSTRSFSKPLLCLVSITCSLIAHNLCTDQWRLCYLLVGNCPLHQYSVCAGSNAASPRVLLMSLMCD